MGSPISNLDKALPVKGRALSLKRDFNLSLLDSLQYLIETCEEVLPSDVSSKTFQKIEDLKKLPKVSGFLSLIHEDFLQAIEKSDIESVKSLVSRLIKDNFMVGEFTYLNLDGLSDYDATRFKEVANGAVIEKIEFSNLESAEFEEMKGSIQRGFEFLKCFFADFYEEAQHLISEVLFLKGERINVEVASNRYKIAGSSCDIFGVIYINFLHKWRTLTDVLDFIVHELSHLYIYALNKDDPLLLNPGEMYESPLRTEKRPLMGSYHATFVLSRVVYVLRKALELNGIPDGEKNYCKDLIDFYQKRFHLGFDLMTERAQMTDLAKNLIFSTTKLVA